jgi:uncharacterized membrane protein
VGDFVRPLLLLHVLSAFVYVSGYIGTNVLTEVARRTDDAVARAYMLRDSNVIDRLQQIGGTFVGITGILALVAFGYSLLTPWVLATSVLYVLLVANGILFWGRVGRGIDQAVRAGDEVRALALLRSPRNVAISRIENFLFAILISLMVLRPGS